MLRKNSRPVKAMKAHIRSKVLPQTRITKPEMCRAQPAALELPKCTLRTTFVLQSCGCQSVQTTCTEKLGLSSRSCKVYFVYYTCTELRQNSPCATLVLELPECIPFTLVLNSRNFRAGTAKSLQFDFQRKAILAVSGFKGCPRFSPSQAGNTLLYTLILLLKALLQHQPEASCFPWPHGLRNETSALAVQQVGFNQTRVINS